MHCDHAPVEPEADFPNLTEDRVLAGDDTPDLALELANALQMPSVAESRARFGRQADIHGAGPPHTRRLPGDAREAAATSCSPRHHR